MAKFQVGHKFSTGRPKGSPDKRTLKFQEVLEANGYNPALALLELQREAYQNYQRGDDKAQAYFKDACNLAMDIAGYVFAKPKAIEITTNNAMEGMTPEQRLEAMKQAVLMLEREVANSSEVGVTNEERQIRIDNSTEKLPG